MSGRGRSSGIRVAGLGVLCACLASGCVSLQENGAVTKVQEQDGGSAQMQIWPSPPSASERPAEIVSGFLEAARSGTPNQDIAAAYLTADVKKTWQVEQNTVIVLADYSESTPQDPGASGTQEGPNNPGGGYNAGDAAGAPVGSTNVEQVQGTMLGRLDASGVYSAQSNSESYDFTLEQTAAGWRISQLPSDFGVLMERSDFETFYSRHVVYYENPQQSELGMLVPAQVYLPSVDNDQQVAEQVARLVVNGPPAGLAPLMHDAVGGAAYQGMQIDGSGVATVQIKSNGACAKSKNPCNQLAQQLAQTLTGLSTKITSVVVQDSSSAWSSQQATPNTELTDYGLDALLHTDNTRPFYAISIDGRLEQLNTSGAVANQDVFGTGAFSKDRFRAIAAEPGGGLGDGSPRLALVSQDQSTLFMEHGQSGTPTLATVYPAAGSPPGGKVGQPGWDYFGNLWFTVTLNGTTAVYRYDHDDASLDQVALTGVSGTVNEVLPAPDGDRVAVLSTDSDGDQSIAIAAVTQSSDGYRLNLGDTEAVASSWNAIKGFDWYNDDSLAVLGMQPGSQELGLYQIYTDGSAVYDSLTTQPVQASPPSLANGFVWTAAGQPIASSPVQGKSTLYTLSVEGQDAQPLGSLTGSSPTY